jgi:hypothetical protein
MLVVDLVKGVARRSQSLAAAPGRGKSALQLLGSHQTLQTAPIPVLNARCFAGAMTVLVEGLILKKGVVVSTWKSRWCSVEGPDENGCYWLYYSDDRSSPSRGTFALKGSFCVMTRSKKNSWVSARLSRCFCPCPTTLHEDCIHAEKPTPFPI